MQKIALGVLVLVLAGCGGALNKQQMMDKADGLKTSTEVEKKFGKPAEFGGGNFMGQSAEQWTYKTSDGKVVFWIVNGKVIGRAAE